MKEYIDKSVIKAEIERLIETNKLFKKTWKWKFKWFYRTIIGRLETLEGLKTFIDTLEVKEMDVEKESELIANSIMISVQANLYHTNVYDYEKRCYKHSDLKDAARKGIELSLKAQKGE